MPSREEFPDDYEGKLYYHDDGELCKWPNGKPWHPVCVGCVKRVCYCVCRTPEDPYYEVRKRNMEMLKEWKSK